MSYRKRSGIQLAYPFEERRLKNEGRFKLKWYPPYFVQPKLNGERCRVIKEDRMSLLLNSTEEVIHSVPHIQTASSNLLPDGEYDGELYVHGWTWAEIHSVVSRTVNLHPRYEEMQLHLFDVVNSDPQVYRIGTLRKIPLITPIIQVPLFIAVTLNELYYYYDRFISEGYEGFIIRHVDSLYTRRRSPAMMKFKPKQTDDYTITSIYEAISDDGTPKEMVGGFDCVDDMGVGFSVGAGRLTHDQRKRMWIQWLDFPDSLKGRLLRVEYQTLSDSKKVPIFSRAVEII